MNREPQTNEVNPVQAEENAPLSLPTTSEEEYPTRLPIIIKGVKPFFTYGILALTIAVFIVQEASAALVGFDLAAAIGMKINQLIHQGEVWRLITPMFLHGSILHIGLNMYALYLVGQSLEPPYGHFRFLGLYLLAGFCGNVFSTLFSPYPSLGSSTAIFGLIAAQGIFVLKNREFFGNRAQRILINIAMIAAINFMIGLSPGIDNWGHLGGFLGGAVVAWFVGPTLQGQVVQTGEGLALILEDERSASDQLIAGLVITCILVGLSAWAIFLR